MGSDDKTELDKIAIDILEQLLNEQNKMWIDESKYRKYRGLQIDKRGSFGERFFSQILLSIYPRLEYNDGDQGDWDIKVMNKKLEIKTASFDVNKKFQNEGIKKEGDYEGILFLGVKPNQLMIKFIKRENIKFEKLHKRKNSNDNYFKWDFKEDEMIAVHSKKDIKKEFEKVFLNK